MFHNVMHLLGSLSSADNAMLLFSAACLTTLEKFGGDCTPAPGPDCLCCIWLTACCILLNPPILDAACFIVKIRGEKRFEKFWAGSLYNCKLPSYFGTKLPLRQLQLAISTMDIGYTVNELSNFRKVLSSILKKI